MESFDIPLLSPLEATKRAALIIADSLTHGRGLEQLPEWQAKFESSFAALGPEERRWAVMGIAVEEASFEDRAEVFARIAKNLRLYTRALEADALRAETPGKAKPPSEVIILTEHRKK
ncbi:MAG: hypothetical protein ACREGR_02570 [Minisyncoccia bacterium]